jgi:hypothetical protein
MALLIPLGLCVLAVCFAGLPPADVRPEEGGGSWLAMGVATAAVLGVCAFAVVQLRHNDRATSAPKPLRVFASSR